MTHRSRETSPRPARRLRALAATLSLAGLVLAGCSDDGGSAPSPAPTRPAPAPPTGSPAADAPPAGEKPAASPKPATPEKADPAALAQRGRSVYMANCIACHNQNPAQDGALGPAVAGSSRALIEARVMRAEYPEGYTPKRDSKVMIALPHLANELDALAAYLQQAG